jgi:CRP-like cAMP-binding protein
MVEARKKCRVVETSELFADVSPLVREAVLAAAQGRKYACRQQMFLIDDPVEEIFLMVEGCAKVTQVTRNGREVVLRIAAPGEVASELGLEPGSAHTSTASALQECTVLVWTAGAFETALTRFAVLQRNVNSILRQRIVDFQNRVARISSSEVASKRLAHELVCLAQQVGQKVNSHIEIKIAQEALAQMTAMGLFTLNRILSGWENQGFLRVHRQCIEIHDSLGLSGLRSLSEHRAPSK